MNGLWRAIRAEGIKLRGTLSWPLLLVAPVLNGLFVAMVPNPQAPAIGPQWAFHLMTGVHVWALMLLPLLLVFEATLLGQLEHAHHKWKHVLSLPIARASLYLAKLAWLLVMMFAAHVLLVLLLLGETALLDHYADGGQLLQAFRSLLDQLWPVLGCALGVVGLQLLLSIALPSPIASLGLGVAASIAASLLSASPDYARLLPWAIPALSVNVTSMRDALLGISLAWFVVTTMLGVLLLNRRQHA